MAKLTLSVDEDVVSRAKQFARDHGTSVSSMVETYLAATVAVTPRVNSETPVLKSLRGVIKNGEIGDYRKHLQEKYR